MSRCLFLFYFSRRNPKLRFGRSNCCSLLARNGVSGYKIACSMKKIYSILLLLAAFALPVKAQFPTFFFNAPLLGKNQVPAVNSNGSGMISLLFNHERTKIKVSGLLSNLDGSVTAANLHLGKAGENGAATLNLLQLITGRKIEGELDAPAGLLADLLRDQIYFNLRTTAHPTGELRGQLRFESDLNFAIEFSPQNMVPAVNSNGNGLGVIHFPVGSEEILSVFGMRGMSGVITGASIFRGQPGETGEKIADLLVNPPGDLIAATTPFTDLDPNFLENAIAGKYFVVLKSAQFPGGEARGQVKFLRSVNSFFSPNPFKNVPPTLSSAYGLGFAELSPSMDSLQTLVFVAGIQPTAANIRRGLATENGPLVAPLNSLSSKQGFWATKIKLSPAELTDFVEGKLYVDFASAAYPNGEIRAPMQNNMRHGYAFDLCGDQVVPKNVSTALGMGMLSVDQVFCYINYKVASDGLSGLPTAVALFNAPRGSNGGKMYDLTKKSPLLEGIRAVTVPNGELVFKQETYISLSTAAFPNGEIRGQVVRDLTCPLLSDASENSIFTSAEVFPNPFEQSFFVKIAVEKPAAVRLVLRDLLGKIWLERSVRLDGGEQVFDFFAEDLPAGLFQFSIENQADGQVAFRKTLFKI